jgi:hypothetical protein
VTAVARNAEKTVLNRAEIATLREERLSLPN